MTSPHKIALLTREYPPEVYGGAGTHVEYLVRELRRLAEVSVHCWGAPRDEPGVTSHQPWADLAEPKPESAALQAMSINLAMSAGTKGAELVHSHTWYANFGGHLAKLMWSIPHVLTVHSLEPLRPWKADQLGGVDALAERVRKERGNLVWINRFLPREDLIRIHTGATVFVCPSIYEPFGLVILEAMACETAVVASRVGGIPEIVVEGETGYLVDYDPADLDGFTTALARRLEDLLEDTTLAARMGKAGRGRVLPSLGWPATAAHTPRPARRPVAATGRTPG